MSATVYTHGRGSGRRCLPLSSDHNTILFSVYSNIIVRSVIYYWYLDLIKVTYYMYISYLSAQVNWNGKNI